MEFQKSKVVQLSLTGLICVNTVLIIMLVSQRVISGQQPIFHNEGVEPDPREGLARSVVQTLKISNGVKIQEAAHEALQESAANCPDMNITITYNLFIRPEQNWHFLVKDQLSDLAASGIHHCATTIIALAVPDFHNNFTYPELQQIMFDAVYFIRQQDVGKDAFIVQEHENSYEYPGIHSLYNWANSESPDTAHNHLFLYFHSKGMVNHGLLTERVDRQIFDTTVVPWRSIVRRFQEDDSIRAAAWMPSQAGWSWHNFWWSRGDWIQKLKVPKRTDDRYFWESWLGDVKPEQRDGTRVLSLCKCDFSAVEPPQIPEVSKKCVPVTKDLCSLGATGGNGDKGNGEKTEQSPN